MSITTPAPDVLPLIRQCLPHDPTVSSVLHLIRNPSLPRTSKQQRQLQHFSFDLNNNTVKHNNLIYIPHNDNLRASLLHQAHDERSSGHHGTQKTLELIRRDYSWPGMTSYIETYISSCDICQHTKLPHRPPQGLLKPLPIPQRPWSSISWDHTELPPSSRSTTSKNPPYTAILVIICRLTKLAHFIPTRTTDNATILAQQFIDNVYRPHGLPLDIVSDRGATFSSAWWKEVTRLLGTRTNLSTAFHPQSDGQTERTNQTIEHYIRAFGDYQQSDWSTLLPLAEFAYNNSFHSAIGMSPFFATYGYHPTATLNASTVSLQSQNATPNIPNASAFASNLTAIHKTASDLIAIAHGRYTKYANAHRRPHDPSAFAPGTLVMINRRNIKTTRPTVKFDDKLIGPFKIVHAVGSHAYRLDLGTRAIHPTFHVDLLHPYKPPSAIPARPTHTKPPAEIVHTNAFLVERILSSRIQRKRLQYLVRWAGYSSEDDSWVPHTEFHNDDSLVLDFHAAHPTLPTRRG